MANIFDFYMASQEQVKQYLAHWFQLGKRVLLPNRPEVLCPAKIFEGDNYSREFERCWQQILSTNQDGYLEGTEQTIKQLLSPNWDLKVCARCDMPVPAMVSGVQSLECPCVDLPMWPNFELPSPRLPVSSSLQLSRISQRLQKKVGEAEGAGETGSKFKL